MRLKDVTEFCPAYTGAARNDTVAFVPMEALRYDCITQQEIPFDAARGKYTFFADGDLLFAKVTPCFENGNIAVAKGLKGGVGFGSSEIFVLRAKPGLNNRYLFYVVQASPFLDGGCATMCGVGGLKRMSPLFPRTFEWEIPSEKSQGKIVAYLDEKTAAIDSRVAVLERKLAAYRRLKASVINRAVTRGLDPKAKLKDSGVDWIGQIPAGWNVAHLKRLTKKIGSGKTPSGGSGNLQHRGCDVSAKSKCLRFWNTLGQVYLRLSQLGGNRESLNFEQIGDAPVPCPSLAEQRAIADYLDAECAKIDKMAELVTREIELYKKLKRSLINEVVTGKWEVA